MKNILITAATFTVLLAGQTVMANDDGQEFLSWLNSGQDVVQVDQSHQFNKVSIRHENNVDDSYKAENDIFSINHMSDK